MSQKQLLGTASIAVVKARWLAAALICSACTCSANAPAQNLAQDPSFEAATPSWFSEDGGRDYFAGKEKVAKAADGTNVLAVAGWNNAGSLIASEPITLPASTFSATIDVRSFGPATNGTVELALFDAGKKRKLATFGSVRIDGNGRWSTIQSVGVHLNAAAQTGVLGVTVSGPMRGSRVELDKVGLFAGEKLPPVVDTAQFSWFEAEDMRSNGKDWKPMDQFSSWYHEFPSNKRMLSGADAVSDKDNGAARYTLKVGAPGRFTLWTRFLRTNAQNHAAFSISLEQKGKAVATLKIDDDSDAKYGTAPLTWVFAPLSASLEAGAVDVVLTRPASKAIWMTRKVDLFVLTNLGSYKPKIQDFRPQGYVRFTNTSTSAFCLFENIRKHEGPVFNNARMIAAAGLSASNYCPSDKKVLPDTSTQWLKVSDYLSPAQKHNNFTLLATTQSGSVGYLAGQFKGTLEFGLGTDHRLVRTIKINQPTPRVLMTLGYEYTPEVILSSADYIAKEQTSVGSIASTTRPTAKHLDLIADLGGIHSDLDPPEVVDKEVGVIEALGFNGTDGPITEAAQLKSFYQAHGLLHVGMGGARPTLRSDHITDADRSAMAAQWSKLSKDLGAAVDQVERAKTFDEPRGLSYEALAASPHAQSAFAAWLKVKGVSLSDLGVHDWTDVLPLVPSQSKAQPRLFYWTARYRLDGFAEIAQAVVKAKNEARIPQHIKTYVNYDPTWGNDSFTQAGVDPFSIQRNGGFELGWTEDWLGYGASPEQLADQAAVIRAAGAPNNQELGVYVVAVDGPPALQRLRLYEALAAGARHINSYNYGPFYSSIDSWGTRYEVYPYISDALHDFGTIDSALDGAQRHRSDVAILYNRTAAIWAGHASTTEQDGRYLFWALSHAGYQPDFIAEEDVENKGLAKYKALYVTGIQIRKRTADAIAGWVGKGGVAFATAGVGSRNEYDQPLVALDQTFGVHSVDLLLVADAGRPKFELRRLQPMGVVATVPGNNVPQVSFNRLCIRESLAPMVGAKVILKDSSGAPVGVLQRHGKGTSIRLGALPGITYLNDAVKGADYDIESYHPTAYRTELRDFIALAANLSHAEKVETNAPSVEVVRYDAAGRIVLIVVNHGAAVPNFEMSLVGIGTGAAYSATGAAVTVRPSGKNSTTIAFSLNVADAVVLTRSP